MWFSFSFFFRTHTYTYNIYFIQDLQCDFARVKRAALPRTMMTKMTIKMSMTKIPVWGSPGVQLDAGAPGATETFVHQKCQSYMKTLCHRYEQTIKRMYMIKTIKSTCVWNKQANTQTRTSYPDYRLMHPTANRPTKSPPPFSRREQAAVWWQPSRIVAASVFWFLIWLLWKYFCLLKRLIVLKVASYPNKLITRTPITEW